MKTRISSFERGTLVRIVAINAAHLVLKHRMMMRQLELGADFQMTLETGLRRFQRVNDGASAATRFNVFATGSVAGLASHRFRVFTFRGEARVSGCLEILCDILVTGLTSVGPNKLGTGNHGRSDDRAGSRAGKKYRRQRGCSPGYPKQPLALSGG
jgi:hypothetical protein